METGKAEWEVVGDKARGHAVTEMMMEQKLEVAAMIAWECDLSRDQFLELAQRVFSKTSSKLTAVSEAKFKELGGSKL